MALSQASKSKRQKQDDSIMATNNSSIVSKRSVERLYYPEPHFFRRFVKKPQRRSPLINRGYWLRMHAVETVVRKFLDEPSEKKKVVMNLGCGYDPLAFQWLCKERSKCQNATFVDIDYSDLMRKKCDVILTTPQLQDLVQPLDASTNAGSVFLRSEHYIALGCDLGDINDLESILAGELDMNGCLILCTAEVSVTYMNVGAADSLIAWATRYDDIRFCLLEQFLPDGADHPFAQKMIQHFENLQTPLRSIHYYPNLADQERRFLQAGWPSATARDLWDLWGDPNFLSSEQRLALNKVEPFDEWEEFALFASHYFLLVAIKSSRDPPNSSQEYTSQAGPMGNRNLVNLVEQFSGGTVHLDINVEILREEQEHRRFGSIHQISTALIAHHGGLGTQSRLQSSDVYQLENHADVEEPLPPQAIEARMCHTITNLWENNALLVGGRTSPDRALGDCWLRHVGAWKRVQDLPTPLYRHCASSVELSDGEQGVLIYGGKSNSGRLAGDWILWRHHDSWEKLEVRGANIEPRFGASMTSTEPRQGILLGGMAADGIVCDEMLEWSLSRVESRFFIELKRLHCSVPGLRDTSNAMNRLGACLTHSPAGLLLVGGIPRYFLPQKLDIVCLFLKPSSFLDHGFTDIEPWTVNLKVCGSRPLLVGHSVCNCGGSVALAGGGAVCFSFGTYWNDYIYTIQMSGRAKSIWSHVEARKLGLKSPKLKGNHDAPTSSPASWKVSENVTSVTPRMRVQDSRDFERVVGISNPVVMEGMNLGPCITEWTLEALKVKVGANRPVVVHEATEQHMNFQTKNFSYIKKPFGDFVDQIAAGSKQYLRSLASEKPSQQPAQLAIDFPELASDFSLPAELEMVARNAHSSPLRISGPVVMWLHYDVMANVLCQIRGSKHVLLYPPSDILHLDIPPGASSSNIDVFDANLSKHPSLKLAHPQEAVLQPGDVLFIPPLWLHTARPVDSISISVNIFFRNLTSGYAAGRDVYGNRDLQAYEKGRKDVEKIVRSFHGLPSQMSKFYLERLADEMKHMAG